ncbi:uncharacterized protein LOC116123044 isoform X2 [Pistacia vera]|uniref:uncharacterized protein LOC116123044 isoform X2 n=1 Tax=Pistacia vera TaxID=55513 RepID=UPI001263416D|nr:uncharacterized protein LOC116123044 isoform X2 [Pistacia vera]
MFRINRFIKQTRTSILTSNQFFSYEHNLFCLPPQQSSTLFIQQFWDKQAKEKERAKIKEEMSRDYFGDIKELRKHGGKIAVANKTIIPVMAAVKFPNLDVSYADGKTLKLPVCSGGDVVGVDKSVIPKASLLCLTFRAMVNSWSTPFLEAFGNSKNIHLYQVPFIDRRMVSFIDSWYLCLSPIKRMFLKAVRKSNDGGKNVLQRQIVYSFGDHYDLRKELKILNLLTGYIFLLDKFGRVRWQGFGSSTPEELSSLLSCTSLLLEEE